MRCAEEEGLNNQVISFKSSVDPAAMPGMLRKSTAFAPRYQEFESISLQHRVCKLSVQAHNNGRVPSQHKQDSEFQRWAAVNRRLRLPGLAILSRAGCGLGQNRVTPGGGPNSLAPQPGNRPPE